jgi:hypothetical protein
MKNSLKVSIACSLALLFGLPVKTQANPAVLAAPAACATGVGCIVVGVVVIAGISYMVWQNSQTGEEYRMPIRDSEEESQSMGSPQTETVIAGTRARAEQLCRELAEQRGLTMQEVSHHVDNQWNCVMY